ncbi:hypothetical protein HDU84_004172 [Entophlyctis sp. JEL0112]|nr:hypothetical protein HDU84_004172 [Entophlyctis sp. JEL0112]
MGTGTRHRVSLPLFDARGGGSSSDSSDTDRDHAAPVASAAFVPSMPGARAVFDAASPAMRETTPLLMLGPSSSALPASPISTVSVSARSAACRTVTFAVACIFLLLAMLALLWPSDAVPIAPLPMPQLPFPAPPPPANVSYSSRAISINGQPELLFVATIHYPRSHPTMWPQLFHRIKLAGNNAIDTYVFWNLHEPQQGQFDFENEYADLPLFLQLAHDAGLYVILRIGPYVCAEWNYGGLPAWILDGNKFPGIGVRTFEPQFMRLMSSFVEKTLAVVDRFLASNGGPIILLQIENEYGNIEQNMGPLGHKYIEWAGDYANSLNVGVPWFMCQQNNIPSVINTVNGMYGDDWISAHRKRFPTQPAMLTELWTGWFQEWGQGKFTRYAEDLAYASARFIASGGTYVGYYMWHGGTNFGKWGSAWKTTSYDYDALLNEFGFPNNPKHNHIAELHAVCNKFKHLILAQEPILFPLGKHAEAHVYGDLKGGKAGDGDGTTTAIVFMSNKDSKQKTEVLFGGQSFSLPQWSVTIFARVTGRDELSLLYSTASPKPVAFFSSLQTMSQKRQQLAQRRRQAHTTDLVARANVTRRVWHIFEPIGLWDKETAVRGTQPGDHVRLTHDASDYLWYLRSGVQLRPKDKTIEVSFNGGVRDTANVWIDDVSIGRAVVRDSARSTCTFEKPEKVVISADVGDHLQKKKKKPPAPPDDSNDEHELAVLVSVAGLCNYGSDMGKIQKGIHGTVKVNKDDVTKGVWYHQIGLKGERFHYYLGSKIRNPWAPSFTPDASVRNVPMVWYLIKFARDELLDLHKKATETVIDSGEFGIGNQEVEPMTSFVLNLESLGHGLAFVNGHKIGRFWNMKAQCDNVPCRFPDSATTGGESCAVGCGYSSQRWYNVPAAWIFSDSYEDVEVVVFDEVGGDPLGVSLGVVVG